MDRSVMANRRLSWMDQVGAGAQRRPSRIATPYEDSPFQDHSVLQESSYEAYPSSPASSSSPQPSNSNWTPSGPPSNLRATAAIWTPQFSSSELDEQAVEDDYFETLEQKLGSTGMEEAKPRPSTPATSVSISSNVDSFPWPVLEGEKSKTTIQHRTSNASNSSPDLLNDPRQTPSSIAQYPVKRGDSAESNPFSFGASGSDGLSLKLINSAPTATTQRGKGLPEIRTTSLTDFRSDDIPGPLASDDSVYAVVEFKLFRAEVYQLRQDWIAGDETLCLVIVEADRGIDLGKISHVGTDPKAAREIKKNLNRKHWSALLQNSATSKPSDEESEIAFQQVYEWTANSPFAGGFTAGDGTMPPRSIVRRATRVEVTKLQAKEGFEEKARRLCWQKAKEHGFTMEILGAEFQFDHQKLTFYFLAPGYVAFNPLINELYKLFKTRIWFVPLNPASFVNPSAPGHSHTSSAGSSHEGLWNAQHTSAGVMPTKNIRRDSRQHAVPPPPTPLSPTSLSRPGMTSNTAYMSNSTIPGQPSQWGNMPKRAGAPGSWAPPNSAQGYVPQHPSGQRLWK